MSQPEQPESADWYHVWSAALAAKAVADAQAAVRDAGGDIAAAVLSIMRYQAVAASEAVRAGTRMLAEQGTPVSPVAVLDPLGFVSPAASVAARLAVIEREAAEWAAAEADRIWTNWRFERLVASMVQDAGREAQSVDVVTRPWVQHVRHLVLPSCARCAALAGRVYMWSQGFQRHPGCDCVMIPTFVGQELTYDLTALVRDGQVTGLSKADKRALADGADFSQLVNAKRDVRYASAYGRRVQVTTEGTTRRGRAYEALNARFRNPDARTAGERYTRTTGIRLTTMQIYREAGNDRDMAFRLLKLHGYIR